MPSPRRRRPSPARRTSPGRKSPKSTKSAKSTRKAVALGADTEGQSKQTKLLVEQADKWKKWWTRFWTSLVMMGGFIGVVYFFGHWGICALMVLLQVLAFREVMHLNYARASHKGIPPVHHWLDWYFFGAAMYFLWGRAIFDTFWTEVTSPELAADSPARALLGWLALHHTLLSFSLLTSGFVMFVLSLEHRHYRQQFVHLCWMLITKVLLIYPSSLHIYNVFNGLVWAFLPASLIVANDTWAYIWGFFFGRTPLIKLSPKKTWEGFIGGGVMTLLTSIVMVKILVGSQSSFVLCPLKSLSLAPLECQFEPEFHPTVYDMPDPLQQLCTAAGSACPTIEMYPMHIHGMVLALFASLVAPFGGFFASGFKRAYNIKDFGETIPGHGGIMDRMDCQVGLGAFTYVYASTFVVTPGLESVLVAIHFWDAAARKELAQTLLKAMSSTDRADLCQAVVKQVA